MLNFTNENLPKISLIINSFSANKESQESNEIIDYFNNKKIKIFSMIDINQEMNFTEKLIKTLEFLIIKWEKFIK